MIPFEQKCQLFALYGATKFPVKPVIEALKVKISLLSSRTHCLWTCLLQQSLQYALFLPDLEVPNEDYVLILFYLQKIFPGMIKMLFLARVRWTMMLRYSCLCRQVQARA